MKNVGSYIRGVGEVVEKMGLAFQSPFGQVEKPNPSTLAIKFENSKPETKDATFVAPNVCMAGDVSLGAGSSVWYGASLRANGASIRIGSNAIVQERACVTASGSPTMIGANVVVGSNAQVHSSQLKDGCVVGANAKLLHGCVVEANAMVAPGAVVDVDQTIPAGQLWSGSPAAYLRDLTAEEIDACQDSAMDMLELAEAHAFECEKTFEEMEAEKEEQEYQERLASPHYFDPEIEAGRSGRMYNSNN